MRRENRVGVFELLSEGNRGELVGVRAVQEREVFAGFAGLIAQRKILINRLIVRGGRQRLRGLFASLGAQKKQRRLLLRLRIGIEGRENFRGLIGGERGDSERLQNLIG